jgi:ribosomal protein L39E
MKFRAISNMYEIEAWIEVLARKGIVSKARRRCWRRLRR